jgi:hypothetical protein
MDALITQWKKEFEAHIGSLVLCSEFSNDLFTQEEKRELEKLWLELNSQKINTTY